jgi:hypothetical protein
MMMNRTKTKKMRKTTAPSNQKPSDSSSTRISLLGAAGSRPTAAGKTPLRTHDVNGYLGDFERTYFSVFPP